MPKNIFLNIHCKLFYTDNVDFIQVILSTVIQIVEPQPFLSTVSENRGLNSGLKKQTKTAKGFLRDH